MCIRDRAIYGSEVHVIADLSDIAADSGSYTVPARKMCIRDSPVLVRTLLTIDCVEGIDEIVIAAREDELLPYAELCKTCLLYTSRSESLGMPL